MLLAKKCYFINFCGTIFVKQGKNGAKTGFRGGFRHVSGYFFESKLKGRLLQYPYHILHKKEIDTTYQSIRSNKRTNNSFLSFS